MAKYFLAKEPVLQAILSEKNLFNPKVSKSLPGPVRHMKFPDHFPASGSVCRIKALHRTLTTASGAKPPKLWGPRAGRGRR